MMRPAFLLFTSLLSAQPHLQNAKMQTRPVSGTLGATFRAMVAAQAAPAWIAYAVPRIPGEPDFDSDGCWLESRPETDRIPPGASNSVHLEVAPEFNIFFRVENRQVEKIRFFSMDCNVDGGGLPFYWITGVKPAESVALLESLIPPPADRTTRRLMNGALSAIALHRDPSATDTLLRLARGKTDPALRKQAMFWLARSKDPRAEKFFEDVLATR